MNNKIYGFVSQSESLDLVSSIQLNTAGSFTEPQWEDLSNKLQSELQDIKHVVKGQLQNLQYTNDVQHYANYIYII